MSSHLNTSKDAQIIGKQGIGHKTSTRINSASELDNPVYVTTPIQQVLPN